MHPRVIAQRQAAASKRVLAAVGEIAANTDTTAPDFAAIKEKSPDVQRVKEWEVLANWLDELVKRTAVTRRMAKPKKEADDAN